MWRILWIILVFHFTNCQNLSPEQEQQLRDFVAATTECRNNAGLSLALVRNGETVFADGFGFRDVDNSLLMTASTRINIGSETKSFTSAACAKAVSQGLVTWDAPLQDVLGPEFGMEGQFRTEELSLRDALAHKIGVPSYWGLSTAAMGVTKEELCMQRLKYFPTQYNFRSRYKYSNYPFVLAGYVQEVVTGQTWDDYLQEVFFNPLGMNNTKTASNMQAGDWTDTAYSYIIPDDVFIQNPEQEQMPFLEEIAPAAGIFSTAEDMAEWLKFHINRGQLGSGDIIIPEDDLVETHTAAFSQGRESPRLQKPQFPVDDMSLTKALGWVNGMYRGHEKLSHTGSYSSYNCLMTILPDVSVGVWACVNSPGDYRGSRAVKTVNTFALDLLLDEEPWLNTTTTCTYPDPWRSNKDENQFEDDDSETQMPRYIPKSSPTVHPMQKRPIQMANEEYIGDYHHPAFGTFYVQQNMTDQSLYYNFGVLLSGDVNPTATPEMFHMTLNPPISYRMVFFPEYPDGFPLYFTRDGGSGNVTTLEVPYLEFDMPPVFTKL